MCSHTATIYSCMKFAKPIHTPNGLMACVTFMRARVLARVERLAAGNPGDVKPVGEGVSELRIDYGPGYRVYFTMRGRTLIILLAGGDKRAQTTDIKTALRLARNL
jgi:putative addiction module killer protein